MKKALLVLVFLISTVALTAQEIAWMSMDQALLAQQKTPKKIFMDVYTTWCGPCKLLDKNTFSNPDVIAYINEHFYPVKFNADDWVTMAKNAGMKYIVITSKHHDGFSMFDSKYTDYKITSPKTPFSTHPKAKVVIASGYAENEMIKSSLEIGALMYIKKPYSIVTMGSVIKNAFNGL